MKMNLRNFMPESVSDQEASNLVDIFYRLAVALDEIYFGQIMRLNKKNAEEAAAQMVWQGNGYDFPKQNQCLDDPLDNPPF